MYYASPAIRIFGRRPNVKKCRQKEMTGTLNGIKRTQMVVRFLFQKRMGVQIFTEEDAAGDHGLGLHPILFDQQGKIEVDDETRSQSGREKAVEKPVVIDKIPAQAEKSQGKKVADRLPYYKSSQDQEEEIPGHGPMKNYLA